MRLRYKCTHDDHISSTKHPLIYIFCSDSSFSSKVYVCHRRHLQHAETKPNTAMRGSSKGFDWLVSRNCRLAEVFAPLAEAKPYPNRVERSGSSKLDQCSYPSINIVLLVNFATKECAPCTPRGIICGRLDAGN